MIYFKYDSYDLYIYEKIRYANESYMITETTAFFYQMKGWSPFIPGVFAIFENWKLFQLNITYDQLRRRSASFCCHGYCYCNKSVYEK